MEIMKLQLAGRDVKGATVEVHAFWTIGKE
jgi:hypothetical protein